MPTAGARIISPEGKRVLTSDGKRKLSNGTDDCKCCEACYMIPKDCTYDVEWPGLVVECVEDLVVFQYLGRCLYVDETFDTVSSIPEGSVLVTPTPIATCEDCAAVPPTGDGYPCNCAFCNPLPGDTIKLNYRVVEFGDGAETGGCACLHSNASGNATLTYNGSSFVVTSTSWDTGGINPTAETPGECDDSGSVALGYDLIYCCAGWSINIQCGEDGIGLSAGGTNNELDMDGNFESTKGDCHGISWLGTQSACSDTTKTVLAVTLNYNFSVCWDGLACVEGAPGRDGDC